MKILFLFKSENFIAPVGPMYISAMALKEGHQTSLIDTNQVNYLEHIRTFKPDVVAYSSSTGESKHYIAMNRRIKEKFPSIFTIMGGPHPTFYPEMIHETTLDAICIGEGEHSFVDLLKALERGQSVQGIPNIFTKNDESWTVRNLVEDLDSLPIPDYSLLYDNTSMGSYPLKSFMTSRGCPYPCTYCFNTAWRKIYKNKGKIVRKQSVDRVIEEIKLVKKRWPLTTVKFYDDIFCYKADEWLEEFSRKYRREINLPFFALTRCDLVTEEMIKLLKYAGCRTLSMSIEAGNEKVRRELLRRDMSNEQIINAHRLCDQYGIYTFTNCIIGLPGTTLKEDLESLDLTLKCKVAWSEFLIFHPYPKTELGDQVINQGMYAPDYYHMHTSYLYESPLKSFSPKEKMIQRNLSVLGCACVVLPWLRWPVVKFLLYWPPNKFFTFLYWATKMYAIRQKIYVTKTSRMQSIRIYLRSLRQELFRHTQDLIPDEELGLEKLARSTQTK
jgi:radical SAM superfamily enzyme YgiQ (UPF0313 family)